MNEYIVLLKDGSEVQIFADTASDAEQTAKENGLQPVPTMSVNITELS